MSVALIFYQFGNIFYSIPNRQSILLLLHNSHGERLITSWRSWFNSRIALLVRKYFLPLTSNMPLCPVSLKALSFHPLCYQPQEQHIYVLFIWWNFKPSKAVLHPLFSPSLTLVINLVTYIDIIRLYLL